MSLHGVHRVLYSLNRDPAIAQRFREDRAAVLSGFAAQLDADETRWLQEGDVLSLYRHGVHPLLLVSASRLFGMEQSAYREALAPAVGERRA